MRLIVLALVFLVLVTTASATVVTLLPDVVPSGNNREYNLTLNNHNYKDAITNITVESEHFLFTQAFGGSEWTVGHSEREAHWSNNSLGTDVVFALFPFRATSPIVNETTYYNLTITLIGETTVQRLRREVKVVAPVKQKKVFNLSHQGVRQGKSQEFTMTPSGNVSDVSATFDGADVTVSNNKFTLSVGADKAVGEYLLVLKGTQNDQSFEQRVMIAVINDLKLTVSVPAVVNTSQGFLVEGLIETSANASLNGSVSVLWEDGLHQKPLDSDNHFVVGLLAPQNPSESTLTVQYDHDGYTYKKSKTIKIVDLMVTENATEETVVTNESVAVNESNVTSAVKAEPVKTELKDPQPVREEIVDIEPVISEKKLPIRPFIITFGIIVLLVLIYLTFTQISVDIFTKEEEKMLEEEEKTGSLSWDDYFDKRRRDDEE